VILNARLFYDKKPAILLLLLFSAKISNLHLFNYFNWERHCSIDKAGYQQACALIRLEQVI
jgi:hypothetical protein